MLSQTIREHLRAAPFEPFVIEMNDGRKFKVPHPDFAAVSPKGTSIFLFRENGVGVHLSTILVASIEPLGASRGKRRRSTR